MNKLLFLIAFTCSLPFMGKGQTFAEFFSQKKTQKKYLLAQIAKLEVFLSELKSGYDIAKNGLNGIGNIKDSDLIQHTAFFNHQKTVSPALINNSKAPAIYTIQQQCKSISAQCSSQIKTTAMLADQEKTYCAAVLANMLDELSNENTDLQNVITSGKLQMTDRQRIQQIDNIYSRSLHTQSALQSFTTDITLLINSRTQAATDVQRLKTITLPQQ